MIKQELQNGLLLRTARAEDAPAMGDLIARCMGDGERDWQYALINGTHPTTSLADFTVVEDAGTGKIVSTMGMIPQTWSYGGLPFGVARMDLVATDEEYRFRGLVRSQFAVLQDLAVKRGMPMQVVVGQPYVYRRLGYGMALPYAIGTEISRHGIPQLGEGQAEPFTIRLGQEEDLPFWTDLFNRSHDDSLVACVRDEAQWRHDIFTRTAPARIELRIIKDARPGSPTFSQPVGGLVHSPDLGDGLVYVYALAVVPGISWLDAAPVILRYLEQEGDRYAQRDGGRLDGFWIGGDRHPILSVLSDYMQRVPPEGPLAWYVRLPDLSGFLRYIGPVLECRLENSPLAGWSGEMSLCFYTHDTDGLTLAFQHGKLFRVEECPVQWWQSSSLPVDDFYRILFGYRSVAEVEGYSAEVALNGTSRALLNALFPKQPSRIFSVC